MIAELSIFLGVSAIAGPQIEASYAGDRAANFVEQRITVCGDVLRKEEDGETVLYSKTEEPGIVIAPGTPNLHITKRICISGVPRRLDGLTQEEAYKRNRVTYTTHVKYDRQYYLSAD